MRLLVLLALVGCETTTTAVSHRVMSLGYARPPAVVVVTRGDQAGGERWALGLRADTSLAVAGELHREEIESLARPQPLCRAVRDALPDQRFDELVVLDVERRSYPTETCLRSECSEGARFRSGLAEGCRCLRWSYEKSSTEYTTRMSVIRASSCLVVLTEQLPHIVGDSRTHDPPIVDGGPEVIAEHRPVDEAMSASAAFDELSRAAETRRWQLVPKADTAVRAVDANTVEVDDAANLLADGHTYWVKRPAGRTRAAADVDRVDAKTARLRTTGRDPIEARDEIHDTTEVRRLMLYGGLAGGVVRTRDESHGTAAASLAFRATSNKLPMFLEVGLEGDLTPYLDTARWGLVGAAGFRYALGPIAPVAFGELGLSMSHETSVRASAAGFQFGAGAGLEISFGRWALLADIRWRRLFLDDWEIDMKPVEIAMPYDGWTATIVHAGIAALF